MIGAGRNNMFWYGFLTLPNGTVDYEIFKGEFMLDKGVSTLEEMYLKFDGIVKASELPLQ